MDKLDTMQPLGVEVSGNQNADSHGDRTVEYASQTGGGAVNSSNITT